jgi:glycine/D-amino acid oxidase-like deaminating enzyme/nitrite reductase/ring-hydroxylating ferredoxin subunit
MNCSDLPGRADSCWLDGLHAPNRPPLRESTRCEVAVVGGGIVGLTAALLLARAGRDVVVVEGARMGQGVTARSTAKITCQHGLALTYIARRYGRERARLYAWANHAGVQRVLGLATQLRIECDLEHKDAYSYTLRAARRGALEAEADLARTLGLAADVVARAPLPFAIAGALRFRDQAQFNPARYLAGIAAAAADAGARLHEHTRVEEVTHHKAWRVKIGRHAIEAQHVVLATNLPIGGPIHFDKRTRPRCHIAMAFAAPAGLVDGVFIDVDRPMHSLRMGRDEQGPILVALGPKFWTGHEGDIARRFRALARWAHDTLGIGEARWRWVNEDYDSPDRIPFAGVLARRAPGLYVATGFHGWGISNGTAAAMLIADQVQGRPNAWAALYDPEREAPNDFNPGGDSRSIARDVAAIAPGEGAVVRDGKRRIAVFRSADGRAHALDAACTHMGCTVTWNNADCTWDCPCHGSMFSSTGDVIHGPATKPLAQVRVPGEER